MESSKIRRMALMAMLVALLAVCSQLSVPVGMVPITAQTAAVMLVGLLLPPKYAVATMLVYILAGSIGLPIFANFKAGFGVLLGPTGGYLYGYLPAVALISLLMGKSRQRGREFSIWLGALACVLGFVFVYLLGAVQLMLLLDLDSFAAAFAMGAFPYVFFEPLKIAAAVIAAKLLLKRLNMSEF